MGGFELFMVYCYSWVAILVFALIYIKARLAGGGLLDSLVAGVVIGLTWPVSIPVWGVSSLVKGKTN